MLTLVNLQGVLPSKSSVTNVAFKQSNVRVRSFVSAFGARISKSLFAVLTRKRPFASVHALVFGQIAFPPESFAARCTRMRQLVGGQMHQFVSLEHELRDADLLAGSARKLRVAHFCVEQSAVCGSKHESKAVNQASHFKSMSKRTDESGELLGK